MRRAVLALTAVLFLAVSACSVVDDGKVGRIEPGALDDTLPPTTSTPITIAEPSTTGVDTPTTLVQTEPVRQVHYRVQS